MKTPPTPPNSSLDGLWARLERLDPRRTSLLLLAAAMAVSTLTILHLGRGQSFTSDEWVYLADWPGWSLSSLAHPDNGHLFITANVILNASVDVFGSDYTPLRVVSVLLVQINAGLFYVLARRRVGPVLALAPAILLLFFGAGFGAVLRPYSISTLLAIGFGLCALLALDREDLRGDLVAAALLAASVISFEWGLFFAVGMAVEMWLRRDRPPPVRFLLPAIPILIWIGWKLWAPSEPGGDITLANIGSSFTSMATLAAALLASITGLFRGSSSFSPTIDADWGLPLVVLGVAVLVAKLPSRPRPSSRFFFLAAVLVLFWLAVSLTVNYSRGPTTDRFVYGGAIVLFLAVAELLVGARISRGAYLGITAVLAFSLLANVVQMKEAGAYVRAYSEGIDAQLGGLEIVRGAAPRSFRVDEPQPDLPLANGLTFTAGQYYDAVDAHGSFGTSAATLSQGGEAGSRADAVIARALAVEAIPVATAPAAGATPVTVRRARDASTSAGGSCQRVGPELGRRGTVAVALPPGGFSLRAARLAETAVALGRFSAEYPVALGNSIGSAVVAIPSDRSDRPWRALLRSEHPFTVCPLHPSSG